MDEVERTRTKAAGQESEGASRQIADSIPETIRLIIDSTPALIHTALPDGYIDFFNQTWLRYVGVPLENIQGWNWTSSIHPDDLEGILEKWRASLASGEPFLHETRVRTANGEYRWMLHHKVAQLDEQGKIIKWYGASVDIDDRKRAEEQLRQSAQELQVSESYLADGQRLAHTGSWAFGPAGFEYWSPELFRIHGLDPVGKAPTVQEYLELIHPQDREFMADLIKRVLVEPAHFDATKRIVRPNGEVGYVRCVGTPVLDSTLKKFVGSSIDVTEHELLTQELRRREAYLAEAQRLSLTGSFGWSIATGEIFWSEETFRILEYDRLVKPNLELVLQRVHPEDRTFCEDLLQHARQEGKDLDFEHRLLMPDGSIKHVHVVTHAIRNELDQIEFVGAVTDVTAAKIAEQRIQQDERELRQILDLTPQHIGVLAHDGTPLYTNRAMLEYFGVTLDQWCSKDSRYDLVHPDDREHFLSEEKKGILEGVSFQFETRFLRHDGIFRWFLVRLSPLKDERGHITQWYGTATDIEDLKRMEEGIRRENIALREEIDKASMFEEIVGSSPALRRVLSEVVKVAPTDSTVLITGQTGTGKELIARAIHKRSRRSARAFVSVNCAAVPQSLIASELFGHEKGAFTGALQRRLGRFELAEGGTIFLDEIGDLPADTQTALLRVLQEREFERVGGSQSIPANVRVIAATNRNLEAAIDSGAFREDLFFRLNVFPIKIPPLRERRDDIAVLVEYFIDRYASNFGKKIQSIDKQSLKMLQSYSWPGNIRELQNIIERAVIVSECENLVVDENWLIRSGIKTALSTPLSEDLTAQEKQRIEAALAETKGRVSGPLGAAVKLGIPRTTLDSKIRALKINTHRFKAS